MLRWLAWLLTRLVYRLRVVGPRRFPALETVFDLEADRTETVDLAAKHADRAERMTAEYEKWARRAHVQPWDAVQKAPRTPAPIPGA